MARAFCPGAALHRLALRKPGTIVTVNSQQLADRYAALLGVSRHRFAVLVTVACG